MFDFSDTDKRDIAIAMRTAVGASFDHLADTFDADPRVRLTSGAVADIIRSAADDARATSIDDLIATIDSTVTKIREATTDD